MRILGVDVQASESVKNLGVLIDGCLTMSDHVNSLVKSGFYQLRQIRIIKRCLPRSARKSLVRAFVNSRLAYCNSLLYDINEGLLNRLQRLQNAAARLIFNVRKFDHVTPLRRELYLFPIRQRIGFKLSSIMYKCQHNLAPEYLTTCCNPMAAIAGRQHLRSAASFKVNVPRTRTENRLSRFQCL